MISLKDGEYFGSYLKAYDNFFFKLSATSNAPQSVTEKHCHENDYISILAAGKYLERSKKSDLIEAGDIVFRPKDYTHKNEFESSRNICFNIEFKPDWKERIDCNQQLPSSFVLYKSGSFPVLYKLLYNFFSDYNKDYAFELVLSWVQELSATKEIVKTHVWITDVQRIIENEVEEFHSLKELSSRAFVSPVYLSRGFKQKVGMTISEYQMKSKLSNALHLLMNTSSSISEISFCNGFYDDAHFIRSFKSFYGAAPHKFRLAFKK